MNNNYLVGSCPHKLFSRNAPYCWNCYNPLNLCILVHWTLVVLAWLEMTPVNSICCSFLEIFKALCKDFQSRPLSPISCLYFSILIKILCESRRKFSKILTEYGGSVYVATSLATKWKCFKLFQFIETSFREHINKIFERYRCYSLWVIRIVILHHRVIMYRGYYMAAWGYEFYLRVLKLSLTSERSERVRDTFSTRR